MSSVLGQAAPLHLRLFVENVEVPVIGALVSATEGSPATAQIEMVPANSGLNLAVRSKVLLFFLDPGDAGLGRARTGLSEDESFLLDDASARELTGAGYKLLFSGELFSMAYSKVGFGGRSLVLQCLDDSNNWDTSYLYTLRYSGQSQESVVAGSTQNFLGLNTNSNPFDDILSSPEQVIRQIALRGQAYNKGVSAPTGMLGGLFGVLELLGGVPGLFVGVTAWHTIQEARVRLIDQIATDSGSTAAALFDFAAFDAWLTQSIGDAGTVISFREVIALICRYIYYNVAPNPVAVYRAGNRNPPDWPPEVTSTIASSSAGAGGMDPIFTVFKDRILELLKTKYGWNGSTKPEAYMSSGYRSAAEQAALVVGTSREGRAPYSPHMYGFAADFSIRGGPMKGTLGFVYQNKPDAGGNLHRRLVYWSSKYASLDALYSSGKFTTDEVQTAKFYTAFWNDLKAAVREVADTGVLTWGGVWSGEAWTHSGVGGDPVHVELTGWKDKDTVKGAVQQVAASQLAGIYAAIPDRERLLTQFFRPDVWFAPPPACNVIFPEEVTNLSFMRDMMRETTRLQLTTFNSVMGDDVILNQVYFAPQIKGVESLSSGGLGTAAKAFIYPHEKFSGIIPKMERISDLSFYSRLSEDQKLPGVETEKLTAEQKSLGTVDNQIDKWAARTAIFTYLSYRYDARRLSVSMTFAPRIVCGFPALVIDRTAPEDMDAAERKTNPFSPNHFIGMVRAITHRLDQSGGSTSVSMSHVRTHKPTLDDLFASSVYDNKGILAVQVKAGDSEAITLVAGNSFLSTATFRWLQKLKSLAEKGTNLASPPADLLGPSGRPLVGPILLEGGTAVSAAGATAQYTTWTTNIGGAVAGPELQDSLPFNKVTYTEQGDTSYIPLEEAIRPPWVSDEYSNANIGAFYETVLGCPSIMDLYDDLEPGSVNGVKFSEPGIADAVEKIVDQYSRMSDGGYLGASFIRELTTRDYATLDQVIGPDADNAGFFWQSCGPFTGLKGSMFSWMAGDGKKAPTTQLAPDQENKVSPGLDPRHDRWDKVVAYRDELLRSVGLRG